MPRMHPYFEVLGPLWWEIPLSSPWKQIRIILHTNRRFFAIWVFPPAKRNEKNITPPPFPHRSVHAKSPRKTIGLPQCSPHGIMKKPISHANVRVFSKPENIAPCVCCPAGDRPTLFVWVHMEEGKALVWVCDLRREQLTEEKSIHHICTYLNVVSWLVLVIEHDFCLATLAAHCPTNIHNMPCLPTNIPTTV